MNSVRLLFEEFVGETIIKTSIANTKLNVALIGFGAQAEAWARNLADNQHQVTIYLRKDSISIQKVKALGFKVYPLEELTNSYDFLVILTPDHTHYQVLDKYFKALTSGDIVFAHGYSFWKHELKQAFPQLTFHLLAPKAIASELRANFLDKKPLYAACSGEGKNLIDSLASAIGVTKVVRSNFKEEAIADLFSEQSLLCGLLPYAARKSYDKLVEDGINPEIAYIECWHEVKLIADAMLNFGPKHLFQLISPNALIGAELFKNNYLDQQWDKNLQQTLQSIKNRDFIDYESKNDVSVIRDRVLEDWANSDIQKTYESLNK